MSNTSAGCRNKDGKRAISPDTALRPSRYFGLSERFWMNLQARYDLEGEKERLKDRMERDTSLRACLIISRWQADVVG
jgi:plasmid maintenance system antidote protein VapI